MFNKSGIAYLNKQQYGRHRNSSKFIKTHKIHYYYYDTQWLKSQPLTGVHTQITFIILIDRQTTISYTKYKIDCLKNCNSPPPSIAQMFLSYFQKNFNGKNLLFQPKKISLKFIRCNYEISQHTLHKFNIYFQCHLHASDLCFAPVSLPYTIAVDLSALAALVQKNFDFQFDWRAFNWISFSTPCFSIIFCIISWNFRKDTWLEILHYEKEKLKFPDANYFQCIFFWKLTTIKILLLWG